MAQATSFIYEADNPVKFQQWLVRFFDANEINEHTIWRAQGMGYANLQVVVVDALIERELERRKK